MFKLTTSFIPLLSYIYWLVIANAQDGIRYVTDEELTQPPYSSVVVIEELTKNVCHEATAYYIGCEKIVTVAHFFLFDKVNYIPARRNREGEHGELLLWAYRK